MILLAWFFILCISYGAQSGELNNSQWISSQSGNSKGYYNSHYNNNDLKLGDSKGTHGKHKEENNFGHYYVYSHESSPNGTKTSQNRRPEKTKKGKIERQSFSINGDSFINGGVGTSEIGIPTAAVLIPSIMTSQIQSSSFLGIDEDEIDEDDGILSLFFGLASGILTLGAGAIGIIIFLILAPLFIAILAPFVLPFLIPVLISLILPIGLLITGILFFPIPLAAVQNQNGVIAAPLLNSLLNNIESTFERIGEIYDNTFGRVEERGDGSNSSNRTIRHISMRIPKENCRKNFL